MNTKTAILVVLLAFGIEAALSNVAQGRWTAFVWSMLFAGGLAVVSARKGSSVFLAFISILSLESAMCYYLLNDLIAAAFAASISVLFLAALLKRMSAAPTATKTPLLHKIFLILVLTSTYQAVGLVLDSHEFPAPGELIEIDGTIHHLHCRGSASELPNKEVAIALAGLPWSSIAFTESLANPPFTVCAHDRLGYGWSGHPADQSRDALTQVKELRELLMKKNISEPVTLIGWSYGGSIALLYHAMYPQHVKSIVLFESTDDLLMQDKQFVETLELGITASNIYRMVLPLGFTRIFKSLIPLDFGSAVTEMTDEVYSMNQAQLLTEKFANAAHYELRSFNQSVQQLIDHLNWDRLKQVPVHVITSSTREKHAHGIDYDKRFEKNGAKIHYSKSDHWGPARGTDDIKKVLDVIVNEQRKKN